MEKEENNVQIKELSVRIENINFHMLVIEPRWSAGELPMQHTLLHNHIFHELFVCGEGEIHIKTEDGNVLLSSGDIAIVPPTKSHVLHYVGKETKGYAIPFMCKRVNDESCADLYKKISPITGSEILVYNNYPDFYARVKKIAQEVILGTSKQFLTALHLFELLFELVQSEREALTTQTEHHNDENISSDIQRMMTLDSLIANRYQQKCCSIDFAKELFISSRQLDRIVNRYYGKSLHKLILDKRFDFAQQLVLTTDLTVEAVAARAGFTSSASLYREFKKRHGMTPAAFRANK